MHTNLQSFMFFFIIFWQRPRRGQSPVEDRGTFVRPSVRPFVSPPQALSGLKSALLCLKSALSSLEFALLGLKSALSDLKPARPERADFRPERADLRPERADIRS